MMFLLLIVPYGIETNMKYGAHHVYFLLIVPYGIETSVQCKYFAVDRLLIVPYGIETRSWAVREARGAPFNRTLWN